MNPFIISLFIIVGLSLVGVLGDFFVRLAGSGARFVDYRWLVLGFLVYGSTAFGWLYVMKHVKFSTLGVFYAISTILFLTLVGVFYFKDHLNAYETIGILTAIISIILLSRFGS